MALTTWFLTALVGLANGLASTDTITWGGDNSRAGYQENHNMDPSVVGSSQFGQLFKTLLPGRYGNVPEQIFSQPLVYTPTGSDTQYVYVATTQNNVYKLNAKTGDIVASRNLHIPFLTSDLDGCYDIEPHVGVTATGVIDPTTETLYLTSKTYVDQAQTGVAQGRPAGRYYIHALNVNDLTERPNFPVDLEGTVAKNNPIRSFNGGIHHQRPGLLHVGQYVYAGFASHCVQYNFTGWVIGWDKTTGAIVERFATQGDGVPTDVKGAGIWMSGGGLASDDRGSMFYATGNGYASQLSTIPVNGREPPTSLEEAAVHMTINGDGSLSLVDFFMPWEKQALDGADKDLGTSPLQILPSSFSCGEFRRIGVVTGKSGKTYWLNLDDLGGYRNGGVGLDDVIQVYQNENSVYAGAGVYPLEGGYIYINVIQFPTHVFKFSCDNGKPSFTKVADSPMNNAYILGVSHGTVTSLNGQPGTGLLWTTDVQGSQLKVFEAVPKDGYLNLIKSFSVPATTKFTRAVFGDGIMYQGTTQGYLYAFGSPVTTPVNCTSPNEFGVVDVGSVGQPRTITCTAVIGVTVSDIGLDDTSDFSLSGIGTLPRTLQVGDTFTLSVAFKPTTVGLISADVIVNTTNSAEGYSQGTHVRLTGTGESAGPLLSISPPTITFTGAIAGSANEPDQTVIFENKGNSPLSIGDVKFSQTSAQGPFTTWDRATATLTVGKFTLSNIPSTIPANTAVTVRISIDTSTSGTFGAYLSVASNGGTKDFTIAGSAGPAPVAVAEFQTPDGTGWVKYDPSVPFTFGNVTENTSRALKFRITNAAGAGGVKLSLTVSKPPFGIPGIIQAANLVDLAEGTQLAPGESAEATMICTVPKAQWNTDPYSGEAPWTMNTNDPNFEKHFFTFVCTAVSEQAPPLLPSGQGKYRYVGCFRENNPGRQLSNQLYGNPESTNAMCIQACADKGYVFCGTQYHNECWGGPRIPVEKVDPRNCNFDCAGDLNQICGGNGFAENEGGAFISLFADSLQWDGNTTTPTPAPNPAGPVVNPGVGQYVSEGCYTEGTNTRALSTLVDLTEKNVANCVAACSSRRNTYAGLEYGGECWCGNTLGAGSIAAPAADCSMPCNDNSTEYCGGPSRLNLYKLDGTLPVPSTSSVVPTGTATTAATPSATAPPANDRIGDWLFQGCYTEGDGVRALPLRTYANDSMTLQSCGGFCQGAKYFGTEYGRECWCGDAFGTGSVPAPLADCSFPCAGDSTQKCGAGNRLQVYMFSPASSSTSSLASSTSTSSSTTSSFSTLSVSQNGTFAASTAAATSATVEAALVLSSTSTLSVSNSTVTSSAPTQPASNSTMTLSTSTLSASSSTVSSSASTLLASNSTISTSASSSTVSSILSASNSTISSSASSSVTAVAATTSSISSLRANSTSTSPGIPVIGLISRSSSAATSTVSAASSASATSTVPSAQTSTTPLSSTSAPTSPTSPSSATSSTVTPSSVASSAASTTAQSIASSGLSTTTVRSSSSTVSSSTSVRSSSSATASVKPTPVISPGNENFTYHGCFSEPVGTRLLPSQILNDGVNMTISKCLSVCYNKKFAGVEYGRECWCGDKLNMGGVNGAKPAANVTGTDCSFKCPGNSTQFCGAGSRLSLYIRNDERDRLAALNGTGPVKAREEMPGLW